MANMLYNGVELPALPEWDKTAYPYALITEMYGVTSLLCTSVGIIYYEAAGGIVNLACNYYSYRIEDGAWVYANSADNVPDLTWTLDPVLWTAYDILTADTNGITDTVYMAGSDPVPVDPNAGSHVTETSGDGYALYNGVKLQNIDSVWTDKETYPYAYIANMDFQSYGVNASLMYLFPTSVPAVRGEDVEGMPALDTTADGVRQTWILGDEASFDALGISGATPNVWLQDQDEVPFTAGEVLFTYSSLVWASVDVLDQTGTVYLAASDPISLDGMNVIEWDGVAGGTYVNMFDGVIQLQKVGEYIDLPEKVIGVFNQGGVLFADAFTPVQTSVGWRVGQLFTDLEDDPLGLVTSNHTLDEKYYDVEPGLWFVAIPDTNTSYISLLAYPASSGDEEETDLKPVYKRVNGAWVKQTAYERRNGEWVLISTGET